VPAGPPLPHSDGALNLGRRSVLAGNLTQHGPLLGHGRPVECLLGIDVLSRLRMAWDGPGREVTLAVATESGA
jgi:hypothetical protein